MAASGLPELRRGRDESGWLGRRPDNLESRYGFLEYGDSCVCDLCAQLRKPAGFSEVEFFEPLETSKVYKARVRDVRGLEVEFFLAR